MLSRGVPRGMHRMHVHPPPPPQPEKLVMRKDKAVGNKGGGVGQPKMCIPPAKS